MDKEFSELETFTLFAPTDAAFEKRPKASLDSLLLSENKAQLKSILQNHILNKSVNTITMHRTIGENRGEALYETLNRDTILIFIQHGILTIENTKGKELLIETPDKKQNNGYIHIVYTVILQE